MEPVIIGTEIKFAVSLTAEGFSMDDDDFTLSIAKGHNILKTYEKSELVLDEEGTYILCIDTNDIGVGKFDLVVNAEVPDNHFEDGYRTEIHRESLMTVKKL